MGDPGDGDLDRNPAPAAVQVNRFECGAPVLLDPLANDPPGLPADFRCLQFGHLHVQKFVARIAEQRAGPLVDFDDLVALIPQEYGVVGFLEERPVALLALAQSRLAGPQLIFCLPQFRDVLHHAELRESDDRNHRA